MKTLTLLILFLLPLIILASAVQADKESNALSIKKLPEPRPTQPLPARNCEQTKKQ